MLGKLGKRNLVSVNGVGEFIKTYARNDNWHEIDKKTGNLGYGWIHYALIRVFKPQRVLVIGSRFGYIPAICALACKDNRTGRVDFVDASYDYRKSNNRQHWGGMGFWGYVNSNEYFGKFALEKHIALHIMTSKDFSIKYPKGKWDYINLDGDHSYKGVKFDFET